MIITITDVRAAGFCVRGIRRWFQDHGWTDQEFREFLKSGVEADVLIGRGDDRARYVVEKKSEREQRT